MAKRWLAVRRNEAFTKPPLDKAPSLGRSHLPRTGSEGNGSPWRSPAVPCPTRGTYARVAFGAGPFQAFAQVGRIVGHSAVRLASYGCNHFTDRGGLPKGNQ